ncbi:hypothetical protein [Thermosediminibacter oceani]|uniref:Uncharacterized protein n=1 Tax=Thermosediminibacter oceani (strain ATCC BAA-1034 / DSM 16646 / JW/IW-1228P) TaxID=555079 RepID=D9S166_THEOJ|nr:hypothetical protein [Thermosediminibacter oceani]ADL08945.1 hypothetical protein Toce_2234 [Thermosediminibacter oceani DSM 16646]
MKSLIRITAVAILITVFLLSFAAAKDTLVLNQPGENTITIRDFTVVSGEALADTSVIVLVNGEKKESIEVGASGLFVTRVDLKTGKNVITVKAVFPSGETKAISRIVYRIDSSMKLESIDSIIQVLKLLILK